MTDHKCGPACKWCCAVKRHPKYRNTREHLARNPLPNQRKGEGK